MLNSVSSTRNTKISDGLDQDEPPGVVAERVEAGGAGARRRRRARCGSLVGSLHAYAGSRARRGRRGHRDRCELVGTQTTSSARSSTTRSAGSTDPRSTGRAVTIGTQRGARRPARPRRPAYGRWRARYFSPSCSEPLSSSSCQVARTSLRRRAAVAVGRGGVGQRRPASPSHGPDLGHLARAPRPSCGSRAARPSSSAMPARTRASGRALGLANTASNGADAALPVHERAGLLGHRCDREARRRRARVTSVSRSSRRPRSAPRRARRGTPPGRRVVGVDATDDQAAELAGGQRRR